MKNVILYIFFASVLQLTSQNLDSLKLELTKAKHDTTRCNILNNLAEFSPDDKWFQYNEQLLKLSESKLNSSDKSSVEYKIYKKHFAGAINNVGYMAQVQGDIQKALDSYHHSLKLQEEIGDKKGIATVLNNIGYIYKDQGDIQKAIEYYDRSLKIKEEVGDKRGIAQTLNNLGLIYEDQVEITKALEYYFKSLKIREEIGDNYGMPNTLNNIAGIYKTQNNIPKAIEYLNRGLKIYEKFGDTQGIAYSFHNIAVVYKDKKDYKKAVEYFENSLKAYEEIGDKQGAATSLNGLGSVYFEQKEFGKALNYSLQSMQIGKELGYPSNIKKSAALLHRIYRTTGNHKLALENYELFIQMRDSLNNIETQKATIKQQTQYEYDKKKALEDEKHAAELKVQDEKAQADKKRQNIIIGSVSVVLFLVAIFSLMLYNRFKTTQKQKQIIEIKEKETQEQKHIIEEKQKEILDSINYAKRIQYTLLAHDEFLKENLPEHFVYFNPKDIVSGDFYWATKHNNKFYLAVCDSTGHGVPGAFMSLLNIGFLSEAINEKGIDKPNEVFDYVRMKLTHSISKEGQKDGFDGILLCLETLPSPEKEGRSTRITYAAANNAPILIKKGPAAELIEANADRMPVGVGERKENFTLHTIEAKSGDMLYLYTDGYADQFGGPKGKKFKYKQLNELLVTLHNKPLSEQKMDLKNSFENWKGNLEQVDDVCVIGIKI